MAGPAAFASVISRASQRRPLGVAAREFAAAGVLVFPCVPGGKRPLTGRGFRDATTDLDRVEAWWREHPTANIGVPTGAVSGVVVVDVDAHGPVNGYRAFDRATRAGLVSGWQVLVDTPSGGMHAYYPTGDGEQRCWQAARAGIDFRGDGGYVVVPPSTIANDDENDQAARYRVRAVNTGASAAVDAESLRNFLDPRPAPAPGRRPAPGVGSGQADVSRPASWVADRMEGERNRGLFWAACRLAENGLPVGEALDVLTSAASQARLGEREIAATVRSAYRAASPQAEQRLRREPPQAAGQVFRRDVVTRPPVRARGF